MPNSSLDDDVIVISSSSDEEGVSNDEPQVEETLINESERRRYLEQQTLESLERYERLSAEYATLLSPKQLQAYQQNVRNNQRYEYLNSVNRLSRGNTIPVTRNLNRHNLRR